MRRLGLFLLSALLLFPHVGSSNPPPCGGKESKNVKFTLVVILASTEGNTIDKRLTAIAAEIRNLKPELKSFRLKTMTSQSVPPLKENVLDTVEGKKVSLVIKHGANQDNKVSLSVNAPTLGQIDYETVCGKFLPIVTRYRTKSGECLILAIRVQPCNGE